MHIFEIASSNFLYLSLILHFLQPMKKLICCLLFSIPVFAAQAQTDTIRVNDNRLFTKNLKPVSRQYLVYRQRGKEGSKKQLSVWQRNVDIKNNQLVIDQKWYGADTVTRKLHSVCELQNFRPIYHSVKNFRNEVEAYNISGAKTLGADSVANNLRKDFSNNWKAPFFNWELDMETFALLPFKLGKKFVIPFYHPGSSTGPAYYQYEVIGEEKLALGNDKPKTCWQLKINYSEQNYAIFWIDKKAREVLKMEELYNGWYRYKIKLPNLPAA